MNNIMQVPKNVIVIGAGGHGRVVADIIRASGDFVEGFLDDKEIQGFTTLGKVKDCEKYQDRYIIIAVGNNEIRQKIAQKYPNLNYYTAVHPSAIISPDVEIGAGSCVMPGVVLNSGAKIGRHCIINTHSTVEHDCIIGDYAHISPGAILCGTVTVGEHTQIGAGGVVKNNISIIADVLVGAGAVVVKDIVKKGTYIGVPAEKNKQ